MPSEDTAQRPDPEAHARGLRAARAAMRAPGLGDSRAEMVIEAYLSAAEPAVVPPEPPNHAVCRGAGNDVWVRWDLPEYPGSDWWLRGDVYAYERAIEHGLAPARRMVELPDPDDAEAVRAVLNRVPRSDSCYVDSVTIRAAIRALTEQGAPDAD